MWPGKYLNMASIISDGKKGEGWPNNNKRGQDLPQDRQKNIDEEIDTASGDEEHTDWGDCRL